MTLKSISQNAKEVNVYHTNNGIVDGCPLYETIPAVFLTFPKLKTLLMQYAKLNCTCKMAQLFYDFVQLGHLQGDPMCKNRDGTVEAWILNNSNCTDADDEIAEHESDWCIQNCNFENSSKFSKFLNNRFIGS
jgi:hypothetical protein